MKRLVVVLSILPLVFMAGVVRAGQVTAIMPVSVTVLEAVTLSVTSLDFGTAGTPDFDEYGTATITVTALDGLVYSIAIDAGSNPTPRTMRHSSGAELTYELFMDSSYSQVWGDDCAGGTYTSSGATCFAGAIGTGSPQTYTVYGVITYGSITTVPPAGTYTDSVTVTVVY